MWKILIDFFRPKCTLFSLVFLEETQYFNREYSSMEGTNQFNLMPVPSYIIEEGLQDRTSNPLV